MERKFYCKSKDGSISYTTDERFIYAQKNGQLHRLELFDGRYYKLRVINGIPILEIDGLRMHLVRDFKTPLDYAKLVVKELGIPKNAGAKVLDTCMGLGYTAIEAEKQNGVKKVITCEISDAVIKLAKWNPYSVKLFEKGSKIEVIHASIAEKIAQFEDGGFSFIIHDPPRYSHAPELYSTPFYSQLLRVLKSGGRLFHYVGAVGEKKGRAVEKKAGERLGKAGFRNVGYIQKLQGLIASK